MSGGDYRSRTPRSRQFFEEAKTILPGGVSYVIRYFDPYPFYVAKARGQKVWDVDGNEYTDYWIGHGALLMGHSYPPVLEAVKKQFEEYVHVGFAHEWEVKLAKQVAKMVESVELFRFTNSGTEADMYASRLARAYTKNKYLAKFEGGWHGGSECLHIGVSPPYDKPGSLGLLEECLKYTVVLPYNDLDGVRKKVKGLDLAAIIVEPVLGAGGSIPAEKDFLKGLREVCEELGALLIFDEVITGFRLAPGGAQQIYGVKPDLTVFGKVLGSGEFPVGGFGGRSDVMELLDQLKHPVDHERAFQGGTFAANPITTRAGYTLLRELEERPEIYEKLNSLGERAMKGISEVFERYDFKAYVTGLGSMFGIHFTPEKPRDARTAQTLKDERLVEQFFHFLLDNGIIYMTQRMPHLYVSFMHTEEDIDRLISLVEDFVKKEKSS